MKVVVLGSGVVGITTAWYLQRHGCEVVIVDRQNGPALETSFANAGEISPGYATPWAAPGVPFKAVKWLLQTHGPLRIDPRAAGLRVLPWLVKMLANCNERSYRRNKQEMLAIASYSRDCLRALRAEENIRYDERSLGTLQLFRTDLQRDAAEGDAAVLRETGIPHQLLDPAQCREVEPGLRGATVSIAGGLRLPDDETGDCFKFTNALADKLAAEGVTFRYGLEIQRLEVNAGRVSRVVTTEGDIEADAYVVALGSYSPLLLEDIGLDLPVYPVKGYSLTAPVTNESAAPQSTIMDETFKIAITRLGDRVRVGGTAELAGYSTELRPSRVRTLVKSVSELFPGSCNAEAATPWTGLRAMTPTGVPAVGGTRFPNLFLNTGHGTLGWTMSCGSARLLADIMAGQQPDIDPAAYDPRRFA